MEGFGAVWKIYKNYPTFINNWLLRNYHEGPVDGRVLMRRKKILEAGRRGKERRLGSRDRRGMSVADKEAEEEEVKEEEK